MFCLQIHKANVSTVNGIANAQYIQNLPDTVLVSEELSRRGPKSKKLVLKRVCAFVSALCQWSWQSTLTEMNVAGRNNIVTTAMVLIAELSLAMI
jgi:hypothetical protein